MNSSTTVCDASLAVAVNITTLHFVNIDSTLFEIFKDDNVDVSFSVSLSSFSLSVPDDNKSANIFRVAKSSNFLATLIQPSQNSTHPLPFINLDLF